MGFLLTAFLLKAQTNTLPDIELVPWASGFSSPVGIEHAGTNKLYVVEQTGKIRIVDANGKWKSHFLNWSDKISTAGFEQGLLGLTFDPDFAQNGYFYIHYTNLEGNSTISRLSVNPLNPDKALPSSELIMFTNDDPFRNHNSGQLAFGPDGYLYIAMGDGGSGGDPFNNAQDLSTTFGKLMRVDPTNEGYDIPPSNPYAGMEGVAEEIWASGLRNPWRFSFDALTGDLWIPDVGQNAWEEVNYTPASSTGSENYGWSCREGLHFFKADCDNNGEPFTDPISEYAHSEDPAYFCSGSITGGFVYRGDQYPDMYGKYIYTDFCTGVFRTTYWDGSAWVTAELGNFTPFAYSTFGQDINGELYVANKTNGTIYKVTDGGGGAFARIPAEAETHVNNITTDRTNANQIDYDLDEMIIESVQRNPIVITRQQVPVDYQLSPNPNNGQFTLHFTSEQPATYYATVTDLMGHEMMDTKKEILKGDNEWQFNSDKFSQGIYLLQIRTDEGISTIRFVVE